MKKRICILLVAVFALTLCACGGAQKDESGMDLANPWRDSTFEEVLDSYNVPFLTPAGAVNERWSVMQSEQGDLIQDVFELDGLRFTARARQTEALEDISGLYFDWTEASAAEVSYCKAALYTNGEAGYIAWVDVVPGLLYNLGMTQGASADTLIALASAAFVPVQGDADGEVPEEKSAERDERYALYWELIDKVTAGLRDGLSSDQTAQLGISDVFARPGAEELGWLLRDLNSDGVDELLFGRSKEGDELTPTYDIFCLLGGVLSHPATGWEFNCWYLLPYGMLINEWSGDGYDHYRSAYGYFNGSLIPGFSSAGREQYLKLDFQRFIEDET